MSVYEKVKKYLQEHLTPVDSMTLAKRFLVQQDTVSHALKRLEDEGFAERKRVSNRNIWSRKAYKPDPVKVAIPRDFRPVRTTPQSPYIRTSYPNIRGYED